MGPEGGEEGGQLIGAGTPEEIAGIPESYTGHFLAGIVEPRERPRRAPRRQKVPAAA
jgi:excinuclease ABC subunit A